MFEKIRSLFASAPKTLPQATETLKEADTALATAEAAFTAELVGRDEKIASLTSELAEAEKQGEAATALLEQTKATLALRDSTLTAFAEQFAVIGLADITNKTSAADVKSKWEAHVSKQTTLALAKTGHPPAHVPASADASAAKPTGAELHAQWKAMKPSPERLAFFSAHEAELTAFERGHA
jgi:hypothetical protein